MKKVAYHILKDSFAGDSIYPLSELKNIYPEIYSAEIKKYVGREKLMDAVNPILNCLWNDVVQFTCLHPSLTFKAIKELDPGYCGKKYKVFTLDLEKIDSGKSCLFTPRETKIMYELEEDQYRPFNLATFYNLTEVPKSQVQRWEENLEKGERMLLWSRTEHFLNKGSVDLSCGEVWEFEV